MNDAPNTHHWKRGDLVIHDADAKCEEMLMRVTGYTLDGGLVRTRYVQPAYLPGMRGYFLNDPRSLHDPARFGLEMGKGKAADNGPAVRVAGLATLARLAPRVPEAPGVALAAVLAAALGTLSLGGPS